MAFAPAWLPALDAQCYQHVAPKAAPNSLPKSSKLITAVLPNSARIKNSSDFARVTKSGKRASTESLVGYLLLENSEFQPRLGLIVGKSIGNSVVRHRIARQVRHAVKDQLNELPLGSLMVIRAMRTPTNAFLEAKELLNNLINLQNKAIKVNV